MIKEIITLNLRIEDLSFLLAFLEVCRNDFKSFNATDRINKKKFDKIFDNLNKSFKENLKGG